MLHNILNSYQTRDLKKKQNAYINSSSWGIEKVHMGKMWCPVKWNGQSPQDAGLGRHVDTYA